MSILQVHEVYLERAAEQDLERLSRDTFKRVVSHIAALHENPRPSGCRKITGSKSDWRIRVGNYRIIYEIDDQKKLVRIMRIRHRENLTDSELELCV